MQRWRSKSSCIGHVNMKATCLDIMIYLISIRMKGA